MKIGGCTCLVCSCEGSIPLDDRALARTFGGEMPQIAHQLCRAELSRFDEVAPGERLVVACTQEGAIFQEALEERSAEGHAADLALVNIRERAGWSKEAHLAGPKIAALLAEAALQPKPTPNVALQSEGVALVYGRDERAIEAATRLADKLDITVLLSDPQDVLPPSDLVFPVLRGSIRNAKGHLGAFEVVVDDFASPSPSSRDRLEFGTARDGAISRCDVILDISGGTPLFPAAHKRDGYLRADPGNPAAILEAVLAAGELVGEFDKPRYVDVQADLCAHSRNRQTGCTRCLDVCPTGAIDPAGDHVAIDPYICAGCGSCHAVCPTGAVTFAHPGPDFIVERLRVLLSTYREAGGTDPVLLVHDAEHGTTLIDLLARLGDGLPARVIPFEVGEITQLGVEFFATAMAAGASEVRVLSPARPREDLTALEEVMTLTGTVLEALGFGTGRCAILATDDADALGETLYGLEPRAGTAQPRSVLPVRDKRALMRSSLRQLHAAAPEPVEAVSLPAGAPFGAIVVDSDSCTMCFSCFNVCPSGALFDAADRPQLSFAEDACVQCGLCAQTCPEDAIALVPRLDFSEQTKAPVVLMEEAPAECIRCGKAFGVQSAIDKVVEKLTQKHWMYSGAGDMIERIRMCADCRVIAHSESRFDPYAGPARPMPMTAKNFTK